LRRSSRLETLDNCVRCVRCGVCVRAMTSLALSGEREGGIGAEACLEEQLLRVGQRHAAFGRLLAVLLHVVLDLFDLILFLILKK